MPGIRTLRANVRGLAPQDQDDGCTEAVQLSSNVARLRTHEGQRDQRRRDGRARLRPDQGRKTRRSVPFGKAGFDLLDRFVAFLGRVGEVGGRPPRNGQCVWRGEGWDGLRHWDDGRWSLRRLGQMGGGCWPYVRTSQGRLPENDGLFSCAAGRCGAIPAPLRSGPPWPTPRQRPDGKRWLRQANRLWNGVRGLGRLTGQCWALQLQEQDVGEVRWTTGGRVAQAGAGFGQVGAERSAGTHPRPPGRPAYARVQPAASRLANRLQCEGLQRRFVRREGANVRGVRQDIHHQPVPEDARRSLW